MTLVAVVHATAAAMAPATAAFADEFPEARVRHLLDDTLITDAERAGGLTPPLRARMRSLIGYALDSGADAVLLSCSMYGPVAEEFEAARPVLSSDAALFDEVVRRAPKRVHVLGPIEAGTRDTVDRLQATVGAATAVYGSVVTGARDALAAGDTGRAARLVAETAARDVDLVLLGQFSLAPARDAAQERLAVPLLSPPHLAANALRSALGFPERT
ncbi:hypothetical protein [Amycolatopsis sp. 195334CR]|uniref:hypothetical protein n=1 Tax=Amycolatopsis sp. 195334CR TaxID=2814588 RepID=UPI001A8CE628|nr:hypothetical protein [Amycolatopsis sp. 195334CR]MBN6038251.1 hypothetical protein [Amycolatopsis sp. 195334CR]